MSECCICFESEGARPLECCGGFLHERCKQEWFLVRRDCPLCRSYMCRARAAQAPVEQEPPPQGAQSNVYIPNRSLRRALLQNNRLQDTVAELRAQNTEYWNDQIDMQSEIHDLETRNQELQEELDLTRDERDRLRDAVGQSDLIIAGQRNALMFLNQQTAMLNTQTVMLLQYNASLTQNVNQLHETVRALRAENDRLRAPPRRVRRGSF